MARIAGIDIPRNKQIAYSLRYIFGIGLSQAKNICDQAGVDQNIIVQNLSEKQVISIRTAMTDLQVKVEGTSVKKVVEEVKVEESPVETVKKEKENKTVKEEDK